MKMTHLEKICLAFRLALSKAALNRPVVILLSSQREAIKWLEKLDPEKGQISVGGDENFCDVNISGLKIRWPRNPGTSSVNELH